MVRVFCITTIAFLLSKVCAFQPVSLLQSPKMSLRAQLEEQDANELPIMSTEATQEVPQATSSTILASVPSQAKEAALTPNTMDEGIYNFNKKLIDTVYDVICFLYPVKGNDRDFARFYVLETVARVPYFAYLSVMHLRETFGTLSIWISI